MPKKNTPSPSTEAVLAAVTRLLSDMGVGGPPAAPPAPPGRGGRPVSPTDELVLATVIEAGSMTVAEVSKRLSIPIAEATASLRALAESEKITLVHEPQPRPGRGLRLRAYDSSRVLLDRDEARARRVG